MTFFPPTKYMSMKLPPTKHRSVTSSTYAIQVNDAFPTSKSEVKDISHAYKTQDNDVLPTYRTHVNDIFHTYKTQLSDIF